MTDERKPPESSPQHEWGPPLMVALDRAAALFEPMCDLRPLQYADGVASLLAELYPAPGVTAGDRAIEMKTQLKRRLARVEYQQTPSGDWIAWLGGSAAAGFGVGETKKAARSALMEKLYPVATMAAGGAG